NKKLLQLYLNLSLCKSFLNSPTKSYHSRTTPPFPHPMKSQDKTKRFYHFFHAPFQVERRIGGVIYFEDIKVRLIAVSADYPPTDAVKYSRFSEVQQEPTPNRNDLN
ncbi:hypothetical protein LC653_46090, partial [Nostoc sp. CHAB 5784]|nr:hypothetical protein [Nostoc mirabile CHAB5784]